MNKLSLSLFLILVISFTDAFAQAKKPTIMVVPSDVWCKTHGFMNSYNNQGTTVQVPDYKRAFQESSDLILAISKINGLMVDRGFPLKNMETLIKALESESAEDAILTSKGGAEVTENPVDKLKKIAKADIIIQLTWSVNNTGPHKSVTYIMQGIDAYSNKEVASAQGTGKPSFAAELPVLLEEAVITNIDAFCSRLQTHFNDMFENGREVVIRIKKFSSWDGDLESDYGGSELGSIIEDWLRQKTVKGRYSTTDMSADAALFEQVRIPLYDEKGSALDARGFLKGLQKHLESPPYSITAKLMTRGLGQASLVLGAK